MQLKNTSMPMEEKKPFLVDAFNQIHQTAALQSQMQPILHSINFVRGFRDHALNYS